MDSVIKSRLGYGCYALGGAYGKKLSRTEGVGLIKLGYELGIRFFDTADVYETEEILGKALASCRDQVAIATKVGVSRAGVGKLSREHLVSCCHASLRRLGTDYVDLYQIHYDDAATPVAEVVETLERLQEQGKIRAYGLGHLPLDRTLDYLESGNPRTVMADMNPANLKQYLQLHPLQARYDFGIIAFSVTGRGLLTGTISQDTAFAPGDLRRIDPLFRRNRLASGLRIAAKFKEMSLESGRTPAQLAIAWVLGCSGVAAALTGPTDPDHLAENCAAMNLRLEPDLMDELTAFAKKEAGEFSRQVAREVFEILGMPSAELSREDLIYCLEHCVETGLVPAGEAGALFAGILNGHDLAACQARLKDRLNRQALRT